MRRGFVGVVLALLNACGTVHLAGAKAAPTLGLSDDIADKCWIFTHLNKSGGSTMKSMLKHMWRRQYLTYGNTQWHKGDDYSQSVVDDLVDDHEWRVVAGGYVEVLRRWSTIGSKCKWFTVFRHPISRMVSAYYYCKKSPTDPLCATSVLDAKDVDLAMFAKHWGNFATRQFVLSLVSIDDVVEYANTAAAQQRLPRAVKNPKRIPGWYLVKLYMDSQTRVSNNDTISDAALYTMLQPVQDLLRDQYAAVGILEDFNTTLDLFNSVLGMPGVDWHDEFLRVGQSNVNNEYKDEKVATLAEAWTNSEIKSYMQLDLLLYEHVVDLFRQQTRAHKN